MTRILFTLVTAATTICLVSCATDPEQPEAPRITASHSVFIEGGVLRVLRTETRPLLYIYVRPRVLDHWVIAGGGGGSEPTPWRHQATMFWAPGDADGWYDPDATRKAFGFLFDSRSMTLTVARGTYAVKPGQFIVIALDRNWQPDYVEAGTEGLRIFEMPDENRKHLMSEALRQVTAGTPANSRR
jgi:hypothetical protein